MGLQSQWSNQSRGPDLNTQCTRVPHKSFPMLNAFHVSESTAGRCVLWPGRKYFGVPRKINVTYGLVLVLGNEQDQTMKQFLFRRLFARGKVCDHFNILILNWALRVFFLGYFLFIYLLCMYMCPRFWIRCRWCNKSPVARGEMVSEWNNKNLWVSQGGF